MPSKRKKGGNASGKAKGKSKSSAPKKLETPSTTENPQKTEASPAPAKSAVKKPFVIINSRGDLEVNEEIMNTKERESSQPTEAEAMSAAPTTAARADLAPGVESSRSAATVATMDSRAVSEVSNQGSELAASATTATSENLSSAQSISAELATSMALSSDLEISNAGSESVASAATAESKDIPSVALASQSTLQAIQSTSAEIAEEMATADPSSSDTVAEPQVRILSLPFALSILHPTLTTLTPSALVALFAHLDTCTSFCLGITAKSLHPYHLANHPLPVALTSSTISQTGRKHYLYDLLDGWMAPDRSYQEVEPDIFKFVTGRELELYRMGYGSKGIRQLYANEKAGEAARAQEQKKFDEEFDALWG